jgi:hypothetical protein
LLLSIAAAVASAGSAAGARRLGADAASSRTAIEAITASRRCVGKVSSPNRSGWEISDSAAPVVAAMTVRAAVSADMRS